MPSRFLIIDYHVTSFELLFVLVLVLVRSCFSFFPRLSAESQGYIFFQDSIEVLIAERFSRTLETFALPWYKDGTNCSENKLLDQFSKTESNWNLEYLHCSCLLSLNVKIIKMLRGDIEQNISCPLSSYPIKFHIYVQVSISFLTQELYPYIIVLM